MLAAVLVIAFVYGWAAEYVGGVAAITGSYLAGVLVAQTEFKTAIDAGIHPLTYSIFVPLFFISIGLAGQRPGAWRAGAVSRSRSCWWPFVAKAIGCGVFVATLRL